MVNCMEIWLAANEDMIRVSELVHLYRLKESKEYGYYKLVPWARKARIVRGLPSSFRYWKSRFVFVSGNDFETPASEAWGDVRRLLRRWGTPHLGTSILPIVCWFLFLSLLVVHNLPLFPCIVKRRPKLKSKYQGRVEKAIEYAEAIKSWEDLVDPRTLAFYCLGPDPSAYELCLIEIEGKKSKS